MPKVKDEYLQDKREQILDAAYRICMQKPVYSVTMKDIITEIGWSQGAIYRYFKNIQSILFELINRQTAHLYVKKEVDAILALPESPERIVAKILDLIVRRSLRNVKGFGKMYFEYSASIADHPEYLKPFTENVKIATDLQYLQKRTIEYLITQVEKGYFKPLLPVQDIVAFIGTSIDGIQRDLVLVQCYRVGTYTTSMPNDMDPQKLMNVLYKSLIYLLGGNSDKEK